MHTSLRRPLLACAIVALAWPAVALADSPLTSTDFAIVYADSPNVARLSEEAFDDRAAEALSDPKLSHGERIAMVNALGWSISGQEHAAKYLQFVARSHEKTVKTLEPDELTAAEALALGYMAAMDRYGELGPIGGKGPIGKLRPVEILDLAVKKAPDSYAAALTRGLVLAQEAMDSDWCKVYRHVFDVVQGYKGQRDLRPEAEKIITEYIGLYASECPNPRPVQGP